VPDRSYGFVSEKGQHTRWPFLMRRTADQAALQPTAENKVALRKIFRPPYNSFCLPVFEHAEGEEK
jgi:hypothetical protein